MKKTLRAKRLERYLSEILGWETNGQEFKCGGCGKLYFHHENYCSDCGAAISKNPSDTAAVFEELESAIAYALGEKTSLKR